MKTLKRIKSGIDQFMLVTALTLLTIMVIVVIYQVFSRQLLDATPSWATPLSKLLLVWISFLGIAYGFKEKLHIGVGIVVNLFPEKIQDICDYLAKLLVIGSGVLMIYYGWQFTVLMGGSNISGLGVPSSVLYVSIPLAGIFITLNGIELLFIKGMHQKLDGVGEE
ncbi:TRAP transporter small permease [Aquibacillus sediminis]|uniref:TRAP transporter small permease n=1 Tax=Aquibacillus sediminis TaxID=2574734 RepID=UPI001109577D|nr:TRAP transporter small permease [Aquibacillus sediminis]